jgi:hypothetical protein
MNEVLVSRNCPSAGAYATGKGMKITVTLSAVVMESK